MGITIPEPRNGAKIVSVSTKSDEFIILAKWGREFVTWSMDSNGDCYWGRYFDNEPDAYNDYMKRTAHGVMA